MTWSTKKLGEICQIRTGKKDVDEGNPEGGYPFFTCSREITYSDTYSFDTEAILVAGNGDVGATKYYKGKFEAYQRTYILDKFKEGDIRFIYYFILAGLKRKLLRDKSGSTMPYVRKGDLESFEIYFPSLSEQKKIVYVLDSIQSAIQVQDKIIEKTKELKKSLMHKLFREGTRGAKWKKTEIGEIPENWEVVRLGDVCERFQYGLTTTALERNTGVKFLRITDIQNEQVDWQSVPYCECSRNEFEKYKLEDGDIVIARIGATTGKSYFIKKAPKAVFASYLIRIKQKSKFLSRFFCYFFQTTVYWRQVNRLKSGRLKTGVNIPVLQSLLLPLPSFSEQREIAEILQTIDQKIEIEQKKKALYEELFKAMLNKLMNREIKIDKLKI